MAEKRSIKKQFVFNVVSGWLVTGVSAVAGLVLLPMNLKFLGKDVYAVSVLATSALGILQFLSFGLGPTLLRFFSQSIATGDYERLKKLSSTAQLLLGGLGLIGAVIFLAMFPFFCRFYYVLPELRFSVFILFLGMAFSFWENFYLIPFSSILQGSCRFDLLNFLRICSLCLRIGALFLGYRFVVPSLSILGIVLFLESTFRLITIIFLSYREIGDAVFFRSKLVDLSLLPSLFSFSILNLINSVFFGFSIQVPMLIVGRMLGKDSVASFAPAITISTFLASILGAIQTPVTPLASKDALSGGKQLGRWAINLGQIEACAGYGVVGVVLLLGKEWLTLWLGAEFAWTSSIVVVMVIGIVLSCIQGINYSLALGASTIKPIAYSSVVMAFLTITGTFAGIRFFSWELLGVACVISVVRLLRNVGYLAYTYSRIFQYHYLNYLSGVYLKPFILVGLCVFSFCKIPFFMGLGIPNLFILCCKTLMFLVIYWILSFFVVFSKDIRNQLAETVNKMLIKIGIC